MTLLSELFILEAKLNDREFKIIKIAWTGMSIEDKKKYAPGTIIKFKDVFSNKDTNYSSIAGIEMLQKQ